MSCHVIVSYAETVNICVQHGGPEALRRADLSPAASVQENVCSNSKT